MAEIEPCCECGAPWSERDGCPECDWLDPNQMQLDFSTQSTDPGCGCSTNPARARYADGDPAGCYCTCSDDAREGCEHEPDEPQSTDQEDQ